MNSYAVGGRHLISAFADEAQRLMREDRSRQLRAERFGLLTNRECQAIQHYVQYVAGWARAKALETEVTAKYPERWAATRIKHQEKYAV